MTNSNEPNGNTPQPDRIGELEEFVASGDRSTHYPNRSAFEVAIRHAKTGFLTSNPVF
jgi:hypothetical protein